MKIETKKILAVIVGVVVVLVVGFVLFPVLEFIMKRSLLSNPFDDFHLGIILFQYAWLGIASILGGLTASSISRTIYYALVTGCMVATIITGISIFVNNSFNLLSILAAAASFFFCLLGGLIWKFINFQKHEHE